MPAAATWKKNDGTVVKVKDMDLDHMKNCVHMVCRSGRVSRLMLADALSASSYATTAPDGAAMAAEAESDALMDAAFEPTDISARLPYAIKAMPAVGAMVRRLKKAKFDYLMVAPRSRTH